MAALTPNEIILQETANVPMKTSILWLLTESVVWGIYVVILVFAIYCMSIRRTKTTRAWLITFTTLILLFSLSTFLLFCDYSIFLVQVTKMMLSPEPWTITLSDRNASKEVTYAMYYTENFVFALEYLIGDAVVIWRTWVLWQGHIACYIPVTLWLTSLGMLLAERITFITSGLYAAEKAGTSASQGDLTLSIVSYTLSITTNAVATAMIAYRAWKYRRFMKQMLGSSARSTAIERMLALLVESGAIYLCIWAISIANNLHLDPEQILTFVHVWGPIGNQIVGVYPTVVIALIELQRSMNDSLSEVEVSPSVLPTSSSRGFATSEGSSEEEAMSEVGRPMHA